jgi:hypothetical protein
VKEEKKPEDADESYGDNEGNNDIHCQNIRACLLII